MPLPKPPRKSNSNFGDEDPRFEPWEDRMRELEDANSALQERNSEAENKLADAVAKQTEAEAKLATAQKQVAEYEQHLQGAADQIAALQQALGGAGAQTSYLAVILAWLICIRFFCFAFAENGPMVEATPYINLAFAAVGVWAFIAWFRHGWRSLGWLFLPKVLIIALGFAIAGECLLMHPEHSRPNESDFEKFLDSWAMAYVAACTAIAALLFSATSWCEKFVIEMVEKLAPNIN